MTIRKAQWNAMTEASVERLCQWLLPHLRLHFADLLADASDAAVGKLIVRSVERARQLGATDSPTICQFVHLRVVFGAGFEALPWVAALLADPGLDGDARIAALTARARRVLDTSSEEGR